MSVTLSSSSIKHNDVVAITIDSGNNIAASVVTQQASDSSLKIASTQYVKDAITYFINNN